VQEAPEIGQPEAGELEALVALLASALHNKPEQMREWVETVGVDNFRVARLGGRVVAGLGLVMMGQWFGGKSVPWRG